MKKKIVIYIIIFIFEIVIAGVIFNTFFCEKEVVSQFNDLDSNEIWCASLQLGWNELTDVLNLNKIEFIDYPEDSLLINLNQKKFSKEMISKDNYNIIVRENSEQFKEEAKKYNLAKEQLKIIENNNSNGFMILSMLEKNLNFLEKFDIVAENANFNNKNISGVTYFGIKQDSKFKLASNIKVLYYDENHKYAVKLKTKENDEIILYTLNEDKYNASFEELYEEITNLSVAYDNEYKVFKEVDIFSMPNIKINSIINYDSLCGKEIKDANGMYLATVNQYINFRMNNIGAKLDSKTILYTDTLGIEPISTRKFEFNVPFVMFLKEAEKDEPYFAVKILDSTFLDIKK